MIYQRRYGRLVFYIKKSIYIKLYIYKYESGKGHFFNVVYMCNIIEKRLKMIFKFRKKVGYRKGAWPNMCI